MYIYIYIHIVLACVITYSLLWAHWDPDDFLLLHSHIYVCVVQFFFYVYICMYMFRFVPFVYDDFLLFWCFTFYFITNWANDRWARMDVGFWNHEGDLFCFLDTIAVKRYGNRSIYSQNTRQRWFLWPRGKFHEEKHFVIIFHLHHRLKSL